MGIITGGLNLIFLYKVIKKFITPFDKTEAFKLGIIDERGKILKKKSTLKGSKEKDAYTMMDRFVWKLKRLLEKIPFGKSRLASYAAALWFIKEEHNFSKYDDDEKMLEESFMSFLETEWEQDAQFLKEQLEKDMEAKSYTEFSAKYLTEDLTDKEEVEITEAFSMRKGDKRVVDAFYDQKTIKAHGASILTTDGKTLTKTGMGGQDIAKWVNGKIKIVAVSDVKSTEQILRYMKKSIPKNNFKPEDYKRFFEEMGNVAPTAPDSGGIQYQEPVLGQKKKKKKQTIDEAVQRTTFAGKDVFIVDSETYYNCRLGKKKYGRYEKYVGNGEVGQTIREYGLKYPRRPIILQNGESGPMLFLKYGRS